MIYYGQELYHHGIKGQRWGIRRYQNEDGSLTPAGLKRYGTKEYADAREAYRQANKEYKRSFSKAYNYSSRFGALTYFGKHKKKSNALWDDTEKKATALETARKNKKIEKHNSKAKYLAEKAATESLLKIQKTKVKDLRREYSDSLDAASQYSHRHLISQWFGKNKVTADNLWTTAIDKGMQYDDARDEYKRIKSTLK